MPHPQKKVFFLKTPLGILMNTQSIYTLVLLEFFQFLTYMDQLGKICQHHWRESLEISEVAKFKSDTVVLSEQRDNSAKLLKFAEVCIWVKS